MPTIDPFYLLAIAFFVGVNFLFVRGVWRLTYFPKAEARAMDRFYRQHSLYYSKLDDRQKKRFLQRAYSFTKSLKIVGRMGVEVTQSIKLMVVAAMVQITFGFQRYFLKKFRTVFVYPDSFRNPHTGNLHDGEVHPAGLISFSLKKLLKGFDDPYDAVNLGLHEMVHALMHTILTSTRYHGSLKATLDDILSIARMEMEKINAGEPHIFRSYAGANTSEFFAVAVEHFFENPKGLQSELPGLYSKLAVLLNQDPVHNNYCIQ